ncbi:MAG: hypothetical protein IPM36_01620 [Lewinellaceae bacterium]|nr:hypothetical protein [Lewinellaceae bacterium]
MTIQEKQLPQQYRHSRSVNQDTDMLVDEMPEMRHQFQLIKGKFSAKDAEELLLELIHNKIKFHSLESLIILERYNGDTAPSQKRIQELKAARASVQEFLKQAREAGWQLEIKSRVEINVIR